MGIFNKIISLLSGGFGRNIVETVKDYFPPSMSDEEKKSLN